MLIVWQLIMLYHENVHLILTKGRKFCKNVYICVVVCLWEVSEYRLIKIECNGRMVEFSGVIYAIGVVHHAIGQFGLAVEKVQAAKALEEAYLAEREAEIARAEREKTTDTGQQDEIVEEVEK